jgi:hypothetical protein
MIFKQADHHYSGAGADPFQYMGASGARFADGRTNGWSGRRKLRRTAGFGGLGVLGVLGGEVREGDWGAG